MRTRAPRFQRLEGVGKRPAQQLDDFAVEQLAYQRTRSVPPQRVEFAEFAVCLGVLAGPELPQRIRF